MKLKKIFTIAAACAVTAMSAMGMNVSAVGLPVEAYLCGAIGATTVWKTNEVTTGSTIANINGDAQYEVEWVVSDGGTKTMEFLIVQIPNLTKDQYPNLAITVDAIYIDDAEVSGYTTGLNAIDLAYYEVGTAATRIYLIDTWASTGVADIQADTTITKNFKVKFTVSGTGVTGTTNVGVDSTNTTPTQAPVDNTTPTEAPTQAPLINNNNNNVQVTQAPTNSNGLTGGAVLGNSTQTDSASTGDAGVAVAVAGLVLTAGIGTMAVVMRSRKK